jgi:hypothetical protein
MDDGRDNATVTKCLDAEWAMDAANAAWTASAHPLATLEGFRAYRDAIKAYTELARLVAAEGLQSEYRQARVDRINAYTRARG